MYVEEIIVISIPHWCNYKKGAKLLLTESEKEFQFHIGAIISSRYAEILKSHLFQFHIGAIISLTDTASYVDRSISFQFHIGAIISDLR